MLSVWLYLIGAATACAYALGASMAWIPASPALAAVSLGIATTFILSAELCNRRAHLQAAGRTPVPAQPSTQDDHTLVDGIEDIVFQADRSAAITFLNRSWKTVTALDTRDCLGRSFFDFVHPDDQALNREQFLKILQPGQEASRFETRLICRDGRQCWLDVRLKPRRGRHGQINGATGIMTDINSRKRAEDVLRARDRSLSTLLDHLPGMAFRCRNDRQWTMEFVSDGCFELTGYEAVDLLDHASYDQLIQPEDREYVWDYVQSQLARHKGFHLRYRIRTREGRERWVEERSRGVFAGNGTLLAIEGFISDISDQKRDEERVAQESLRDTLTGLKSRALLVDRVAAAIEDAAVAPRPFFLLCVDIDNLERINERHGRSTGDKLLVSVGRRLAQLCRAGVAVGRNSGDEFGLLIHCHVPLPDGRLPELPALARFTGEVLGDGHAAAVICATAWVDLIAGMLEAPFDIDGSAISIGARVGIALGIDAPRDAEAMFRDAAQAACVAQWLIPGSAVRYAFAGAEGRQSAQGWRHAAAEFARAFDVDALEVELAGVAGSNWVEGHARWHTPRSGPMPPAQIFLHAYQAGMLEALLPAYVGKVCAHGIPSLQPGQRLAVRLDGLPPSAPLLGAALGAVNACGQPGAAGRVVLLLALPGRGADAPPPAVLEPLRRAGLKIAVDVTAAVMRGEAEPSGWMLLADCWRLALDPAAARPQAEADRLALMLDLASRRGITVIAAAGLHAATTA